MIRNFNNPPIIKINFNNKDHNHLIKHHKIKISNKTLNKCNNNNNSNNNIIKIWELIIIIIIILILE